MEASDSKILTRNQEKIVKSLYKRKNRYEHRLSVCEGLRVCREIYQNSKELIKFAVVSELFDRSWLNGLELYVIPESRFQKISATVNSQGIIMVVDMPEQNSHEYDKQDFYILLDRVADPGNFGTIIRTAAAVGLNELWYSRGSVDPFSEKTIRSALAAQFRIKLHEYENLDSAINDLKSLGVSNIYMTEPSHGESCFKEENLFTNSAIVFGNEAGGLDEIEGTIPLNIPMPGKFESLNLAQSVTVILFEHVRREQER